MATGEFVVLDFTALAAWPLLLNLVTHASLVLELLYPVLIWVRIARPLLLAGVLALHLGIAVMSPGLAEFALVMIAGNFAFVSGAWLRAMATGSAQPSLTVLYDGGCPRCRSSMALITAADPDHVVEMVDLTATDVSKVHPGLRREDCMKSMHAVSNAGRVTHGFQAVRAVATRLPLFWPLAMIGYLPGVAWLGRGAYNRVAAARPRDVARTDLVCGIHSPTSRTLPPNRRPVPEHPNAIAPITDAKEVPRS